jgi:hypothetical protein
MSRSFREKLSETESKPSLTLEGKEIEFSRDNAADLLRRFPWIFEQVAGGVGNRGLFMPASATP